MAREDGDVVDRVRASDDGLETGDGQGLAVGVGDGGAVARETQGGASADAGEDALVEADRGEERVPTLLAGGEVAGVGVGDDVLGGGVEADVEENLLARVEPMQRRGVPRVAAARTNNTATTPAVTSVQREAHGTEILPGRRPARGTLEGRRGGSTCSNPSTAPPARVAMAPYRARPTHNARVRRDDRVELDVITDEKASCGGTRSTASWLGLVALLHRLADHGPRIVPRRLHLTRPPLLAQSRLDLLEHRLSH